MRTRCVFQSRRLLAGLRRWFNIIWLKYTVDVYLPTYIDVTYSYTSMEHTFHAIGCSYVCTDARSYVRT